MTVSPTASRATWRLGRIAPVGGYRTVDGGFLRRCDLRAGRPERARKGANPAACRGVAATYSRRRDCHSAAPPSHFSRCFNIGEEGGRSKVTVPPTAAATPDCRKDGVVVWMARPPHPAAIRAGPAVLQLDDLALHPAGTCGHVAREGRRQRGRDGRLPDPAAVGGRWLPPQRAQPHPADQPRRGLGVQGLPDCRGRGARPAVQRAVECEA